MNGKSEWKLEWNGDEFLNKLEMNVPQTLDAIGHYMVSKIRETLSQKGSGRIYSTGRSGGIHQASAPGEPPAVWSGELRRTVFFDKTKEEAEYLVKVGSPSPYAARLEFGDSHIAKRPWLGITFKQERKAVEDFLETGLFK
jgi:phage gpG-like protein